MTAPATPPTVEDLPLEQLREWPRNPRRISKPRLEQLKRALEAEPEMLRARPLIALPDGTVVAGNQRLRAARELGWPSLPVVVVDLDEARATEWALRDNRPYGEDDEPLVGELLAELAAAGRGLDLTGYESGEVDRLLAAVRPAPEVDPDEAPPLPADPKSVRGEVYDLGPHRLMCGDATSVADVGALLDGADVSAILTDPPYCSGGFQESGKASGSVGTTGAHKQIANDRLSTRGYIALLKTALNVAPAAFVYVFTDWRMWVYLFDVVESSGFGVRSMIVWDKGTPGMGRGWRSQHELIMWGAKKTPPFDKHASGAGNVIASDRTGNPLHTTQKPIDLLAHLLATTPFAVNVYDPFAGAGSVLIAAEQERRVCFSMELDPAYCDVIRQRYADFTGQPELAP